MTPGWMPLYQQLFLIAHDADGEPRVHPTGLSLALSAAVLAELALGENLQVRQDRLWALGGHNPHPDPLADAVVTAIRRVDGPKQVPHWLRVMSGTCTTGSAAGCSRRAW